MVSQPRVRAPLWRCSRRPGTEEERTMFGYEFSPSHRNAGLPSSGEDAADDKEEQARVGDERQDNVDATRGNGVGVGDAENREDEAEDGVEHGEQNAADDDGGLDRVARL